MKIRWETKGFPDFSGIPEVRLRLQGLYFRACNTVHGLDALEVCDHSEGSSSRRGGAPVRVVAVLAPFQEVLVSVVIGLLIEHPCAIHHHTGVELTELEGLINRWAVYNTLCRLASKILFIIESDFPGLSIHLEQVKRRLNK